jgi:hypothetical protein
MLHWSELHNTEQAVIQHVLTLDCKQYEHSYVDVLKMRADSSYNNLNHISSIELSKSSISLQAAFQISLKKAMDKLKWSIIKNLNWNQKFFASIEEQGVKG